MVDNVSPETRRRMMRAVRGVNTKPEVIVRRLVHRLGFRFRLHRRDLPGTPDLVLPRLRVAMFVHGCFWHRHPGCKATTTPSSNVTFWMRKFDDNVARDDRNMDALARAGWNVHVVWECETKKPEALLKRLRDLLSHAHATRVSATLGDGLHPFFGPPDGRVSGLFSR